MAAQYAHHFRSFDRGNSIPGTIEPIASQIGILYRYIDSVCGDSYLLDDGLRAKVALSCLIQPQIGDKVCVSTDGRGGNYITAILNRADATKTTLQVSGGEKLTIAMPKLELYGDQSLELSAPKLNLTAMGGKLVISARQVMTHASDSIVEVARSYFGKVSHYGVQAAELMHLKSRQKIIVAEKDIRLDGEHINMG